MKYTVQKIAEIIGAPAIDDGETIFDQLLTDSRKIHDPEKTLFFALKGPRRDGHRFIPDLYHKGVRCFVISEEVNLGDYPDAHFLLVEDTLIALQQLAAAHRSQFDIPVIGLTGSNGKTIVKEWLCHLLQEDFNIVRSPKSYNSQIGVPLSVWQINAEHGLAIFEAGISQPHEMERLEAIIQPGIGILTNIGQAHNEGFDSFTEKSIEKVKLFKNCRKLIYGRDNSAGLEPATEDRRLFNRDPEFFDWSFHQKAMMRIVGIKKEKGKTLISFEKDGKEESIEIPFTDDASVENAITCWCTLIALGKANEKLAKKMKTLPPVNMRLELRKGINNCSIINDSYSADLSSLEIALNFLDQQNPSLRKTVILSDFLQSAIPDDDLYEQIHASLVRHGVRKLIGVGENFSKYLRQSGNGIEDSEHYTSTDDFLRQFRPTRFKDEVILVKGARIFEFERIVRSLEQKAHETVLEINLNSIVHNLKEYQKLLTPATKVMAMVKAFAYGSGGAEIAGVLQYHKVDYLAVAYADEGVELRRAGITLPIMVMSPQENAFDTIVNNNLEPEIFSFGILESFDQFLKQEGVQQFPVHIEIESGMNRLGFDASDMDKLSTALKSSSMMVQSAFSHLAASEDSLQDEFTEKQIKSFKEASQRLKEGLGYDFISHIANSAAVVRHPTSHMDMVRLGIGLYGVDSSDTFQTDLQPVAAFRSTIAQLKSLKAGESVSYSRQGIVDRDSIIATIRVGYADGYPRRLGNGAGKMNIRGKLAPVIGTVCMDMTMIDVTDIPNVKEGDEVVIFGPALPIQQLASWAQTIPYEIMTGISQRVKRVYFEE